MNIISDRALLYAVMIVITLLVREKRTLCTPRVTFDLRAADAFYGNDNPVRTSVMIRRLRFRYYFDRDFDQLFQWPTDRNEFDEIRESADVLKPKLGTNRGCT